MPDDFDSQNPFDGAAEEAAAATNMRLASAEAKLTSVNWDQIRKMLPNPVDQQQLDELMKIVRAATDHNEKVASLIENISSLGSIVVKVLSQLP